MEKVTAAEAAPRVLPSAQPGEHGVTEHGVTEHGVTEHGVAAHGVAELQGRTIPRRGEALAAGGRSPLR
jgi:hypothetical protein